MNYTKYLLTIFIILAVLSCSKLPFSNNDSKVKEEEMKKKEQELKDKEQSLKDKEQKQFDEDKEDLAKKEEELKKLEKELSEKTQIRATSSPDEIPTTMIENINKYATTYDQRYLKRAYNLWYNPSATIGSYDKFLIGFSNTLDDKITSIETASNDGLNATVLVVHVARELNKNSVSSYDKYQTSKYEARYRLVSVNGQWKILSGKVTILSRDNY